MLNPEFCCPKHADGSGDPAACPDCETAIGGRYDRHLSRTNRVFTRKKLLTLTGALRRLLPFVTPPHRQFVDALEDAADALRGGVLKLPRCPVVDFEDYHPRLYEPFEDAGRNPCDYVIGRVLGALVYHYQDAPEPPPDWEWAWASYTDEQKVRACSFAAYLVLLDVFREVGSAAKWHLCDLKAPGSQCSCKALLDWNDRCAVRLAKQLYQARAFGDLPVLADALEDAGPVNPEVVKHLRGPGPHVRGCWAVDLILKK